MTASDAQPLPIHKAQTIAEDWNARIKSLPEVKDAIIAGEIRRWRDTVGRIDLAISTSTPQSVIDFLTSQPEAQIITAQADSRATLALQDGTRVQFWLGTPERFGGLLLQATGSPVHFRALQARAQQQGWSLSKSDFSDGNGRELLSESEEEVYQRLGLAYIPPELRESRGEIEAARQGALPKLINRADLHSDLHMHSDWSDGRSSIREMADAAIALGHQVIAIADHSPLVCQPIYGKSISADNLLQQREAIRKVQQESGGKLRILHGIEVDIHPDGELDLADEVLAQFELVLASLHTALDQPREVITQRLLNAIHNPHVNIIAHPSGRALPNSGAQADWETVFRAAVEYSKILEINSNPHHLDLNDRLAKQAAGMSVKFAIDTDAHSAGALVNQKYGIGIARRAWLSKESVINCFGRDDLIQYLRIRSSSN